jgi:D-glycero-D-manno-heptose 1,7-bisphosphate phosphatase
MKKAIFLDRDGVINVDKGYVYKIDDFEFMKGIFDALLALQKAGYLLIIVTNQSGIGRGYFSEKAYKKLTDWMLGEFKKKDIFISKVYHCPHTPEEKCKCRKPMPGMLLRAIDEFNIDSNSSWMIGDKRSDMEAGKRAGVKKCLLVEHDGVEKSQLLFDIIPLVLGK